MVPNYTELFVLVIALIISNFSMNICLVNAQRSPKAVFPKRNLEKS